MERIGQSVPDERDAPRVTMIDVDSERIRRKSVLGGRINEYPHCHLSMEDLQVTS